MIEEDEMMQELESLIQYRRRNETRQSAAARKSMSFENKWLIFPVGIPGWISMKVFLFKRSTGRENAGIPIPAQHF